MDKGNFFFGGGGGGVGEGFGLHARYATPVTKPFSYACTYRTSGNQATLGGDEKYIEDLSETSSDCTLAYFAFSAESVTLL